MMLELVPHPANRSSLAVEAIRVTVAFQQPDWVKLRFCIKGSIERLRIPPQKKGIRTPGLWEHTCLEMFSRNVGYEAYEELNFSPSTDWAAFEFDSYRSGMSDDGLALEPRICVEREEAALILHAQAALAEGAGPWSVGLSAVIEELDGTKSYWALAHPDGPPDFHDPACFVAHLPAIATQ